MTTVSRELPYRSAAALFDPLAGDPWAMLLDSAGASREVGRWDILVCDPVETLVFDGTRTETRNAAGSTHDSRPFLSVLRERLRAMAPTRPSSLPFTGGAVGYLGYDLARQIERLPSIAPADDRMPVCAIGLYDSAVLVDHATQRCELVGSPANATRRARIESLSERLAAGPPSAPAGRAFECRDGLHADRTTAEYHRAIERILAYIRDGDCYQVNYAQRLRARVAGDPWLAYCLLRELSEAPFSAYLNLPHGQVLSSSPERFLRLSGGVVRTEPIKGTRPRDDDPDQDAAWAAALAQSAKDRAENLMIVDLLRNDLGRVCRTGSIEVPQPWAVRSFANVHHLVSTITGVLREEVDAVGVLEATFPGGSITGAPKVRAMQIIDELEVARRGVYCGAIGYIGLDGRMDFNIAIRTMTLAAGELRFWAGGGIVADSSPDAEFAETIAKAATMRRVLSCG